MSGIPLGFALARAHARHAARPDAGDWRRLDGTRTASQYLDAARRTGLRGWLRTVGEEDAQATVELKLRGAFRDHADEVARWLPRHAAPAARWIARLPDLPALDHLQRGNAPQAWMADDPGLAAALENPPGKPPFDDWLAGWNERWPAPRNGTLSRSLGTALRDLAVSGRAPRAAERLHWMFRSHTLHAAGVYAYLGLVLDDLRRLAAGLARRRPGESRHLEAA